MAEIAVGVTHMEVSRSQRGSSSLMSMDAVVFTTVLTLAVLLNYVILGVRAQIEFTQA